jgi:hypothetical protein
MGKIRKPRLVLTLFVLFVVGWYGLTKDGNTALDQLLDLPRMLENETRMAQYDAYARSLGKTTEQLASEYYQKQLQAQAAFIANSRAKGQFPCLPLYDGPQTNCYIELAPHRGLPALGGEPTTADFREGRRRTLEKAAQLLQPMFVSLFAALLLAYVLPALVRGFWAWLAPAPDR